MPGSALRGVISSIDVHALPAVTPEQAPRFVNASPPPKPRTDWFIWSLHLIFGLCLGVGVGLVVGATMLRPWGSARFFHLDLIGYDQLGIVVLGVALIVGAITSFKGNRAWFKPSLWDAEQPSRNRLSGTLSITIGTVGLLTVAWSVCQHLAALPPPNHSLLKSRALLPLLTISGLMLFVIIYALREGTLVGWAGGVDRAESPLVFWMIVVCITISLAAMLLWLIR